MLYYIISYYVILYFYYVDESFPHHSTFYEGPLRPVTVSPVQASRAISPNATLEEAEKGQLETHRVQAGTDEAKKIKGHREGWWSW